MESLCCVIHDLLKTPFSRRTVEDKKRIISLKNPTPSLNLTMEVSSKNKKYVRHFQTNNYSKTSWLAGCAIEKKLFCWPCILFSKPKDVGVWVTGFNDLNHLSFAISRHEKSAAHLNSMLDYKIFGRAQIDMQLDVQKRIEISRHNDKVTENREMLKRLIDACCFLSIQNLAFRGHDESLLSNNRGNYVALLELISNYDPLLKKHLLEATVFRGTSHTIQNDLIDSISQHLTNEIKNEITNSTFISILLDEASDISHKSQLSVMFRFLSKDGKILERFYCFTDVSEDRSAAAISDKIINLINTLNCGNKLVAQSYDGAAVMSSELNGIQARVRKDFTKAIFIHCMAHRLNLVLSQSVEFISDCKRFFATVTSLSSFFNHSTKRIFALEQVVKRRFPQVSAVRWNLKSRIVTFLQNYRQSLEEFFQNILENPSNWDAQTLQAAQGFTHFFEDFINIFILNVFHKIFAHVDVLFDVLQSKHLDISYCIEKIEETTKLLALMRNDFQKNYDETVADVGPPRKRRNTEDCHFLRIYNEILDTVLMQLKTRFENLRMLRFVQLLNFKNFSIYKSCFPEEAFKNLQENYGESFDFAKLKTELIVFYSSNFIGDCENIESIIKSLIENDLKESFSEIYRLAELVLTLPISTASVERSFSTLKRIKTFTRSTMIEERLSGLATISVEKSLLMTMKERPEFYQKIIEIFCIKSRRIEFLYK